MPSIQSTPAPILTQPTPAKSEKPQVVSEVESKTSHSIGDTFAHTAAGWAAGANSAALLGGVGAGALTYFGMKEAPVFHRALFGTLAGLGGAAGGAVVGGLGGAVAGALADSKSSGTMIGAATGAVAGAVAGTALSLKSSKAFDIKVVAGVALLSAAAGAVGGFASAAVKGK